MSTWWSGASENSNLPHDCLFLIGCDAICVDVDGLLGLRLAVWNVAAMFELVTFKNSLQLNVLRFFLFCN